MMTADQATEAIRLLAASGYETELYYTPRGTYAVHVISTGTILMTPQQAQRFVKNRSRNNHP